MSFALLAGVMALLTGLAVLAPALRGRTDFPDRADASMAIFRDQLAEVDREAARGLLSEEEARAARLEIERRMLSAARASGTGPARAGRWAVIAAAVAVPLGGAGVYALVGRPGAPSVPFAERAEERAAQGEVATLAAELRARLEADPDGGPTEGWVLLAQTHLRRGDYAEAVRAFEVVSEREDVPPGVLTQHAEAIVGLNDGIVTPPAMALIDRAMARDPTIPAGAFYRAQALAQSGDPEAGRERLLARLAEVRGPEPWIEVFVAEANRMGEQAGLPPVAVEDAVPGVAAVAAMPPEEREAAIRSMVDGLAARLEGAPDDLEGWLRLGQARAVLGEADAARDAWGRALALMPEGDARRADVEAAMADLPG